MSTIEIFEASYWEHFKAAKELALYLPINHPKRLKIEQALKDIQQQISDIKMSK